MKNFVFFITTVFLSLQTVHAQDAYSVVHIADSLKQNADAVIRVYNTTYTRSSVGDYALDVHFVITVLNKNGNNSAELTLFYDRNTKVSDLKGFVYNKNGQLQHAFNKNEILDLAANNSYTLFSDSRLKFCKPAVSDYPYTIEYKYTIENKGIVGFNTWMPQKGFNTSVEIAKLTFCTSEKFDIKYKELNYSFLHEVSDKKKWKIYYWTANNLKAVEHEPHMPNSLDFIPAILLSPDNTAYEDTKGDFSSWKSYGKWGYNLIINRDELPLETSKFIKELTDTIPNKKEKAKAVYKYMQSRTRYVNVTLGIGGFQPLMATDVDKKGYGDCKALTNYTKALLKCAGLESFYTEIGSGDHHEIKFTDFASTNQTNHIILCLPVDGDTVWLECTNQKIPFGYIGTASQNRYALMITPDGGLLVKTPSLNANQNTRTSNTILTINDSGNADFIITTKYYNNLYSEIFELLNISEKEQKDALLRNLSSYRSIKLESFSVKDKSDTIAKGELFVKGNLQNYASIAGKRMLFTPGFFHKNELAALIQNKRKVDIYEPLSYSYIDSLQINIPKNYSIEYVASSSQIESTYGECLINVKQTESAIMVVRKLSIKHGNYNFKMLDEISNLIRSMVSFENKKIIITKTD
ncbi:MAG: DUF3857 domain-containing protein [Bacteroidales bacterium]|nr:DUF3857 domain-containing protein [Bacteroidales bacterium]